MWRLLLTGWIIKYFYMTGLILKLSYNQAGISDVVGGICGSCFFIDGERVVTANHVINKKEFVPNIGYSNCQFWIIIEPNIIIEINKQNIFDYPEIDTTLINLEKEISIKFRGISKSIIKENELCFNEGFIAESMPELNVNWQNNKLNISTCNYNKTDILGEGYIKSLKQLTVDASDMKLDNVDVYETSYGGIKGMSGGPLILKKSNEIIGLMSIGLPQNKKEKEVLFAININEIISRIEKKPI